MASLASFIHLHGCLFKDFAGPTPFASVTVRRTFTYAYMHEKFGKNFATYQGEKNASNETSQIRDHQIMYKRRAYRQLALIVLENAHKMPNANGNILQV